MLELMCNRTQELKENDESKEQLVAAGTVLGAAEQYGGGKSGELELGTLQGGAPLELSWLLTAKGLLKTKCPVRVPQQGESTFLHWALVGSHLLSG